MTTVVKQFTVAKCTEEELDEVREYLDSLRDVIELNDCYDTDDSKVNQEIADVARQMPKRSFIVPLNLGILLDNYQDKESYILEHPKWIKEMIELLEEVSLYLENDPKGTELRTKVRTCLDS